MSETADCCEGFLHSPIETILGQDDFWPFVPFCFPLSPMALLDAGLRWFCSCLLPLRPFVSETELAANTFKARWQRKHQSAVAVWSRCWCNMFPWQDLPNHETINNHPRSPQKWNLTLCKTRKRIVYRYTQILHTKLLGIFSADQVQVVFRSVKFRASRRSRSICHSGPLLGSCWGFVANS